MRRFTIALSLLVVSASAVQAQLVPEAASCAKCTIESRVVARLGTADGPGSLPGRATSLRQDGSGQYWVGAMDYPKPLVFDATGKFVREFGSIGQGPNEFRRASLVAILPGDSLLISDLGRVHVVGPSLETARSIRLALGISPVAIVSWPNNVIAVESGYSRQGSTYALRRIDFAGEDSKVVSTIEDLTAPDLDSRDPVESNRAFARSRRRVGVAGRDHVWVADWARYRIVRYGEDGKPQLTLERKPSWFTGEDGVRSVSATTMPAPRMDNVVEDANGRVWVFAAQPHPNAIAAYKKSPAASEKGNDGRVANLPGNHEIYRTMIEIIDPNAKRVVARRLLDGYVFAVISANKVATYTEDADGIPYISVLELTLKGQ